MEAYSSARSLYTSGTFFDANENPFNLFDAQAGGLPVNRYPDGKNVEIRSSLAAMYGLPVSQVSVGNGSDELIDLLVRIFCIPGKDSIIICPPTFGMYKVSAIMNDVEIHEVPLVNYGLDLAGIEAAAGINTKILFICNPNNPTGTVIARDQMIALAEKLNMIVVIDEAYADFMEEETMLSALNDHENLIILRTLSKAFALAGARLGVAMSSEYIISLLQKVKFPYNINMLSTGLVLKALEHTEEIAASVHDLIAMRREMEAVLGTYQEVLEIIPSQANFLCIRVTKPAEIFNALVEKQIIIRKVNPAYGMGNALRISIGSAEENRMLLEACQEIMTVQPKEIKA